jgi:hypothetical protein
MTNKNPFKAFIDIIEEIKSLEGRDIRSALVPNTVKITQSKEEAYFRSKYENYMKKGVSSVDKKTLQKSCENFLKDMVDKGIMNV